MQRFLILCSHPQPEMLAIVLPCVVFEKTLPLWSMLGYGKSLTMLSFLGIWDTKQHNFPVVSWIPDTWGVPKILVYTPKSSILIGFSTINHPFWGTPIFGKHPYLPTFCWFLWDPRDLKDFHLKCFFSRKDHCLTKDFQLTNPGNSYV